MREYYAIDSFTCWNCRKVHASSIKKCSRCTVARYCSSDCQKDHWKNHSHICDDKLLKDASEKLLDINNIFLDKHYSSSRWCLKEAIENKPNHSKVIGIFSNDGSFKCISPDDEEWPNYEYYLSEMFIKEYYIPNVKIPIFHTMSISKDNTIVTLFFPCMLILSEST